MDACWRKSAEHSLSLCKGGIQGYGSQGMRNSSIVLSELLTPATINLNLKGQERDGVLAELVDQVPELADNPEGRQTLLKALHDREKLHSTGIGDGVALPHARNALVGLVHKPIIVFGRHATGIPYDAVDRVPAQLFFLLIAPTVTEHLAVLARISRVLRHPRVRQGLLTAATPAAVVQVIKQAEAAL